MRKSDGGKMEKEKTRFFSAVNIAYMAVLLALVIVLQVFGGYFKIGATSLSFVLVPIVLSGMLLGVMPALVLGVVFGLVVIFDALGGMDPFTLYLLNEQPVITVLLCIVKGGAAGAVSALAFKLISKKNKYVAVFVASATAPIINTLIFVLGALCISGTISDFLNGAGIDVTQMNPFYIVLVICVGINFFVELAINLICAPALYTVNKVISKQIKVKNK